MLSFFQPKKAKPQPPGKAEQTLQSADNAEPSTLPQADRAGQESHDALDALSKIAEALAHNTEPKPAPAAREKTLSKEAALEEKKKNEDRSLYKALLSGLYDAVIIVDARGTVIGSNGRTEKFFCYDAAELWNMPCTQLISAITPRVLSKIQMHAEEGRFTVVSATCRRKDGSSFPAEIAISKIDLLNKGDLILSVRNQERREKAREAREIEICALSEAGAGIAVVDTDGMIEYANQAMIKILQLETRSDMMQQFIGNFCTSHEAASALIRTPSSQGNWLGEMELVTAKGIKRNVMTSAALSSEKHGKRYIIITMTPIPARLGG